MKTVWEMISQTFRQWQEDGALTLAAALAFTTVTSMAPLVTMMISVASLFYGEEAIRGELVAQTASLVGKPGAEVIQAILANAAKHGSGLPALWSAAMLLVGASAVFAQLQSALNTIWNVAPKPDLPWTHTLQARLVSMALVLGVGLLLLGLTTAGAALTVAARYLTLMAAGTHFLLEIGNFACGVVLFTGVFGALFKILPDAIIGWRHVWAGALATSALFNLGRLAISLYISKAAPGSAYGAAGSLIVLLLWSYYSASILFLGAEFTQVYARRFGARIRPADYAYRTSTMALPVDDDGNPILHARAREKVNERMGGGQE